MRDITPARYPTIIEIQTAVVERFSLCMVEMISHRRSRSVARPRQIAMYLARRLTPRSLPEIGRHFGGRDHTTVMHACRRIEMLSSLDRELGDIIGELAARLSDPDQLPLPLS